MKYHLIRLTIGLAMTLLAAAGSTPALASGSGSNKLTGPTNQIVCPGDNATFRATASGPTPYRFTWYLNNVLIPGRTNSSLTITNVSVADLGTYKVILNGGNNKVTNSATLSFKTPVSATPLTNLVRAVGSTAFFATKASGTPPFSYVWKKNDNVLPGKTQSSLTIPNLTVNDSGTYSVIVNGACGSSVTHSATLTVDDCFPAMDVMLVLDRSGSMKGKPYEDARKAATNFVNCLHLGPDADQAGLVSYNSWPTLDQKLTNSRPALLEAIGSIPGADGLTSITRALNAGQAELVSSRRNPEALPVLVLLSDGMPTGSDTRTAALNAATQAKNAGTRIFTVGLGDVDHSLMAGIASSTNDYFYTTNSSHLTALFEAISTVICRPPTNIFLSSLSNATVCAGSPATFTVTASGCAPFTYQWKKGTTVLAGETNSTLVIPNASAADAGTYSVDVTGECATVTGVAVLTVNEPVIVADPLSDQAVCPGGAATFTVEATGTGLGYQWFKGTNALNGQTGSSLILSNVSAADEGIYSVIISAACGEPVSLGANLTLNAPVIVTEPPSNQAVCPAGTAMFSVGAIGTGLTYQWFHGSVPLLNETNHTLTLTGVTAANAGTYSVTVSGACSAVTISAELAVNPAVTAVGPVGQTNCPGDTVTLSTIAGGAGPFSYQWFRNSELLSGETAGTLTITNADTTALYSVVVSGACGLPVTNSAVLVIRSPVIASGPTDQVVCPGMTASFEVAAAGTPPFTYQWFKDDVLLPDATSATLSIGDVSADAEGTYSVVVTSPCNSVTNHASLTVTTRVSAVGPDNQTQCQGATVVFSTAASGTGPFGYVWFKDSAPLTGETNATLTLTNLNTESAGTYQVIVTGACGSVTNSATLSVNENTTVTPMASLVRNPGETAAFTAVASGTGPFTYVWKKNGTPMGETGDSITLSNLTYADEGTYTVEVSGACNTAVESASLHINLPPTAQIVAPTNGSILGAPASFTLAADAQDSDGTVTNVAFFAGTNHLGDTAVGNPYVITLTNLPAGTYTFLARATDNYGASGTSAPVTIQVIDRPPLTVISAIQFNPQNGLYQQTVRVSNPTGSPFDAVRVYVLGLPAEIRVYNPSGMTNGIPYVQSNAAVPPGSYVDFVIEYHVTAGGLVPAPTLIAEVVPPRAIVTTVLGTGQHINRGLRRPDGSFMLEFATQMNRVYRVQYSDDLRTWKTVPNPVMGNGTWIQWIDNGLPKTESAPWVTPVRFYRVILLP